jgi:hypothetical protein
MQSYVERAPRAELAGMARTVWVQRTCGTAYVQRHLPTGGVEQIYQALVHKQPPAPDPANGNVGISKRTAVGTATPVAIKLP